MTESIFCGACGSDRMSDKGMAPDGRLYRCGRCHSWRLEPRRFEESSDAVSYGADYRDGLAPGKLLQLNTLFQEAIGERSPGSILDVGCGDGSFLENCQRLGWEGIGVDCDPGAVRIAKQRGLQVFESCADDSAELSTQCDVATLWDVIEHVPDPRATMRWLADIVRPGGRIMILTPVANGVLDYFARGERALSIHTSQRLINLCLNRYHLHRFSCSGMQTLLEDNGFTILNIQLLQVMSLKPAQYLSGFAHGIPGWTGWRRLDRGLSVMAFMMLRLLNIKNKLWCVAERKTDSVVEAGRKASS